MRRCCAALLRERRQPAGNSRFREGTKANGQDEPGHYAVQIEIPPQRGDRIITIWRPSIEGSASTLAIWKVSCFTRSSRR